MQDVGLVVDWAEMVDTIVDQLPGSVPTIVVQLSLAFVVLVLGWYLSKIVVRLAGRTVARRIERPSVTRSVLRVIRGSVLLLTVAVVAVIMEVGGVEILLSVTVISAVVAIVLAPLVGSLVNGLFILADRPFEIGDMIEVADEGHRGFVEDITIRYTKIFTLENTFIVIPNSVIHERDVINYSAEDERTRIAVSYEVTYGSDLEAAVKLAERGARNVDVVIGGGPDVRIGSARYAAGPSCDVDEFADDGIRLIVRFWVSRPYKLLVARSDVLTQIRELYADADVEFAYPHRQLVYDDPNVESGVNELVEGPDTGGVSDGIDQQ